MIYNCSLYNCVVPDFEVVLSVPAIVDFSNALIFPKLSEMKSWLDMVINKQN